MARELLSPDASASRSVAEIDPPQRSALAVFPSGVVGASKSSPLLEEAREIGRFEAEAFDRRLRDLEQSERAEILEQIVSVGLPRGSEDPVVQNIRHHDAVRLQRDLDRLSEFHRTLVTSRSWRLLQLLRRPFGRAW